MNATKLKPDANYVRDKLELVLRDLDYYSSVELWLELGRIAAGGTGLARFNDLVGPQPEPNPGTVAELIHYPICWDRLEHPNVLDALRSFHCPGCSTDPRDDEISKLRDQILALHGAAQVALAYIACPRAEEESVTRPLKEAVFQAESSARKARIQVLESVRNDLTDVSFMEDEYLFSPQFKRATYIVEGRIAELEQALDDAQKAGGKHVG